MLRMVDQRHFDLRSGSQSAEPQDGAVTRRYQLAGDLKGVGEAGGDDQSRPLIGPGRSALGVTVVPWAGPATSFGEAPTSSRIARTPRTRPMARIAGVLATLVTRMAPEPP